MLPGRSAVSSPPTEIVVATFVWLQRSTVLGCINVVVGDAGPCGRRWRSGRSVHGAALRDWPALGPDAPSARRLLTVSRPTGCGVVLSGDEVGVLGEQRASMNCCERAVWSTADVDIGRKVSLDAPTWGRRDVPVDCHRARGHEGDSFHVPCVGVFLYLSLSSGNLSRKIEVSNGNTLIER